MLDKDLSYEDFLKYEWEGSGEVCPICGQPTKIKKVYEKNTYEVRGEKIAVRHAVSICPRCGERWVNTKGGDDGLKKAYAIYTKRRNPEARKFKTISFQRGVAYAAICPACAREYSLKERVRARVKHLKTCDAKGCNNRAVYLVMLGKI